LVKDEIGAHPYESQIAALLPHDFMTRRKRHKVTESFERDTVAVMHELSNCFSESCSVHHEPERSK
jgi:hypothetical protein